VVVRTDQKADRGYQLQSLAACLNRGLEWQVLTFTHSASAPVPVPVGKPFRLRECVSPGPGVGLKVLNFALISSKGLISPFVFPILVSMSASTFNHRRDPA
jgi:hypothetical protein